MWLRANYYPHGESTSQGRVSSFPGQKTTEPSCSPCQGADGACSLLKHVLLEEMRCVFPKSSRVTWGVKQRAVVLTFFILFLRACLENLPALYLQQDFLFKGHEQAPAPSHARLCRVQKAWGSCQLSGAF